MNVLIADDDAGRVILTTDSAASSYGAPVLRVIVSGSVTDYGPGEMLGDIDRPDSLTSAAQVVATWGGEPGRTRQERTAARAFCRQWGAGPQVA